MDMVEEVNTSSANINGGDTIEMEIIEKSLTVGCDNISVRMSSGLTELNRNMTMAVLPVTVFIGIEAFVGFFGNILILMIYSKKYERSNFRYFVLSMAVIDLTSCCTTLPGEIFSQMNWYDYQHGWICKVKSYMNVLTAWGSASILLLMAFDRYRKVCRTLSWQIQPSLALKLCFGSAVLSALVAAPIAVLWGKQTYVLLHEGQNITVSICEKSGLYADDIYPLVYICCVYIIPVGLMVIVVCFLNILTAKSLFGRKSSILSGMEKCFTSSRCTLATSETDLNSNDSFTYIQDVCDVDKEVKVREIKNSYQNNHFKLDVPQNTTENSKCKNVNESENKKCDVVLGSVIHESSSRDRDNVQTHTVGSDVTLCKLQKVKGIGKSCISNENDLKRTFASDCNIHGISESAETRKKRKTIIMLILTSFFLITMSMYVILITLVASKDGILKNSSNSEKVVFFFFWRLYFANTIMNPLLYGFLDPRFRAGLCSLLKGKYWKPKKRATAKSDIYRRPRQPVFTLH